MLFVCCFNHKWYLPLFDGSWIVLPMWLIKAWLGKKCSQIFSSLPFSAINPVIIIPWQWLPHCLTVSHWETRWLDNQINLQHWWLCLFQEHQTMQLRTFVWWGMWWQFPKLDSTAGVLFPGSTEDRKYHISALFDPFNILVTLHYFYKSPFRSCNKDYREPNQ